MIFGSFATHIIFGCIFVGSIFIADSKIPSSPSTDVLKNKQSILAETNSLILSDEKIIKDKVLPHLDSQNSEIRYLFAVELTKDSNFDFYFDKENAMNKQYLINITTINDSQTIILSKNLPKILKFKSDLKQIVERNNNLITIESFENLSINSSKFLFNDKKQYVFFSFEDISNEEESEQEEKSLLNTSKLSFWINDVFFSYDVKFSLDLSTKISFLDTTNSNIQENFENIS